MRNQFCYLKTALDSGDRSIVEFRLFLPTHERHGHKASHLSATIGTTEFIMEVRVPYYRSRVKDGIFLHRL
jgi:hypothetical protein